jgi:hypothetical protein
VFGKEEYRQSFDVNPRNRVEAGHERRESRTCEHSAAPVRDRVIERPTPKRPPREKQGTVGSSDHGARRPENELLGSAFKWWKLVTAKHDAVYGGPMRRSNERVVRAADCTMGAKANKCRHNAGSQKQVFKR